MTCARCAVLSPFSRYRLHESTSHPPRRRSNACDPCRERVGAGRSDIERRHRVVECRQSNVVDRGGKLGRYTKPHEYHGQRDERLPVGRKHHDELGYQSERRVGNARRLLLERLGGAEQRRLQHSHELHEGVVSRLPVRRAPPRRTRRSRRAWSAPWVPRARA